MTKLSYEELLLEIRIHKELLLQKLADATTIGQAYKYAGDLEAIDNHCPVSSPSVEELGCDNLSHFERGVTYSLTQILETQFDYVPWESAKPLNGKQKLAVDWFLTLGAVHFTFDW